MFPPKLQLKVFVTADSARIPAEAFIPIFHRWIKERLLPELVVDVANYAHVPEGPGVGLIGHGSDYFMDCGEGRLGLVHTRKRSGSSEEERLRDLVRRTLHVAALLEKERGFEGKLRFAPGELLFRVNDRLAAANDEATFAALAPELAAFAEKVYGGPCELRRVGGPKELFAVRITHASGTPLATLLERAGGPPGPDASLAIVG
jgi:hypothetical protein